MRRSHLRVSVSLWLLFGNPIMPIISPILTKEIRMTLRTRRAAWLLFLLLAAVGGVFLMAWTTMAGTAGMMGRAQFSRSIFLALSVAQFCLFTLIAPIMTAMVVTGERENKTLDLLYCTGISRLHLLLAKWLATVAYQLVLFICLLPIMALTFQLGGVGLDEYGVAALFIGEAILTYGMIGMAYSCRFRKSTTAMMASIFTVLFLVALWPLGFGFISGVVAANSLRDIIGDPWNAKDFGVFVWSVSPFTALANLASNLVVSGSSSSIVVIAKNHHFQTHLEIQATIFILSAWFAWKGLLKKETARPIIAKKLIDDQAVLERRRKRFPYYLIDPLRRAQEIGDRQNPVYVKEKRVGGLAKIHVLIRISYVGLILSIPLIFFVVVKEPDIETMGTIALWAISFVMLFMPILASTGITREREENTLDLLQTTLLTPSRIVWGKFLIALRFLAILYLSILFLPLFYDLILHGIYGSRLNRFHIGSTAMPILQIIPFLFSFSAFYAAVGLLFSSVCKRNVTAIVATYVAIILLITLPLIVGAIVELVPDASKFAFDRSLFLFVAHRLSDYVDAFFYMLRTSLETLKMSIGPVVSPYYYFTRDYRDPHFSTPHSSWEDRHFFTHWDSWIQISIHTAILTVLAALLVQIAALNLERRFRKR